MTSPEEPPERDLDQEFDALNGKLLSMHPSQNVTPLLVEFSKLFIDTLQAEDDRSKWTDLSKRFPLRVRLFAMSLENPKVRESFVRRLDIPARVVSRWHASLQLEHEDAELAKTNPTTIHWRVQKPKVNAALRTCEKFMLHELKENPPQTIDELRQVLDATHEPGLQLRMLDKSLDKLDQQLIRPLFTEDTFARFKKGIRVGILQDEVVVTEGKGVDATEARRNLEALLATLAGELRERLLRCDEALLPESILGEYPASVRYRVIGEQQGLLRSHIEERIRGGERAHRFIHPDITSAGSAELRQLKYLRSKTAEIKDELGEPNEAQAGVRLLMNLRRKLWRSRKHGKKASSSAFQLLAADPIRELPVKIVMAAVRIAEWNNQERAGILKLVLSMPIHAFVRILNREINQMLRVTPDRYYEEMAELKAYLRYEFPRFVKRMRREEA